MIIRQQNLTVDIFSSNSSYSLFGRNIGSLGYRIIILCAKYILNGAIF